MEYALVKYFCSLQSIAFLLVSVPTEVAPTPCSFILPQFRQYFSLCDGAVDQTQALVQVKRNFLSWCTVSNSNYFPRQGSGLPKQWYQRNWGGGNEMLEATGGCLNWHCSFGYTFNFSLQNFWLCPPEPKNNEKVTVTESLIFPWICRTQHQAGHFRSARDDPGRHSDGSKVPGFQIYVQYHLL